MAVGIDPQAIKRKLQHWLWEVDLSQLPHYQAALIRAARIAVAVGRDIANGDLSLRATSLVYTTLLSLVPLLALSFAMFKAFGMHSALEPALVALLEPLGDQGAELAGQLVHFVENVRVGVLSSLGLVMLMFTVVSLLQKIEGAFNAIWHVSSLRPLVQRVTGYLSTVLLGPLLVFTAMGLTASVMSSSLVQQLLAMEPFGSLFYLFSKLLPYLLVITAFTFVYIIIPNTRVRPRSALAGAVVAGVLWNLAGWGFAAFVVSSTKYTAIYSSFAIVILFLIWLYVSWLILLLGASIAFYHQHPALRQQAAGGLGTRAREALALEIMRRVACAYAEQGPRWSLDELAGDLQLPQALIGGVVETLLEAGLLVCTDDEPGRLLPGRDPAHIDLKQIVDAIAKGPADEVALAILPAPVRRVMEGLDLALGRELAGTSLRDLAGEEATAGPVAGGEQG